MNTLPHPDDPWRIKNVRQGVDGLEVDFERERGLASQTVLDTANDIIHGERAASYGPAEESFDRIGKLWSIHLSNKLPEGVSVDAYDVAIMMTLMKCARAQTDVKMDTFVDIAGYAALAPRCAEKAGLGDAR